MSIYGKSRMINIDLLKTNTFLDLPTESKLLYIFIICEADDDGVVNVEPLLRYLNLNVDALNILQIKGFILPLGNAQFRVADSIFFIKDFHLHNTIPSNKKKDSLYKPVIKSLYPDEAKYLTEPAHKERKINTNYFEINEEELEVIEEKKDEYDNRIDTNENIQDVNFEINKSCAKLNQTKLNQTKLNHHLLQEETENKDNDIDTKDSIDDEEDIKLKVGELFYGKYQNILLTDNDIQIINTWKNPSKLIDITSEFIKNSTSSFKSQFPIIEQKAKEYGWFNSKIHYFGRKRRRISCI